MEVSLEYNNVKEAKSVQRPLKTGEEFLVPCLVKRDGDKIISFTPVIDFPHNDIENGQPEVHYHADYRFIKIKECKTSGEGFKIIDEREGFRAAKGRAENIIDGTLEYHILPVINETHDGITQQLFVRNSRFKQNCIQKGRCPHRGYDLSQEVAINGIITCPLHNLKFNEKTGVIIPELLVALEKYRKIENEHKKRIKKFHTKLNKIKDGDTITLEEYERLVNMVYIFSQETIGGDKNFSCELRITRTDDFISKPIRNGKVFKFNVVEK